jgi:hypothetical protein
MKTPWTIFYCYIFDGGTGFSLWLARAGIRPLLRLFRQASSHRIALDVYPDSLELAGVTNPVVEGFILPGGDSCAIQQSIGLSRRLAFHRSRDSCQFNRVGQQQVNVIGHRNERMQHIPATRSIKQVCHDTSSDFGSSEPLRTVYCSVKPQIPLGESMPVASAFLEGRERTG